MRKGFVAFLSTMVGIATGVTVMGKLKDKKINIKEEKIDKFKNYYYMLNQWLMLKQEGKGLEDYFQANNYKTIAIYGMGELGNRLYDELKETSIRVLYAVDKNPDKVYSELKVVSLDEPLEEVDAFIVTATFAYDEIEKELSDRVNCPIISLENVVYEA